MRFELTGESVAVNLVVAYAPTEANPNTQMKEEFWKKLGHMVEQIPTKECLFVLVDANARTGKRMEECGDGRVLGAYGRDELNSNGKRLLAFASDNRLALTNTFFSARKGGISHTFNGISSRNDRKRIDYILTRQAHRSRVHDVKVHPQPPPPAKADSDHNIVYAMVRLSGRFAPNRRVRTKNKIRPFDRQKFRSDGDCRQRVVARVLSKLPFLPSQPKSISEMAESFADAILDAVAKDVPPPPRHSHKPGWCETTETSAAIQLAWDAREDARRVMRIKKDKAAWKTLRKACANLRRAIDAALHAYLEEYLTETERLLADNDQRGFYKHLKATVGLDGRKARSEQFIRDEDGTLLRDKVRILERWARFFGTLLTTK